MTDQTTDAHEHEHEHEHEHRDDGYDGPAVLVDGDTTVAVRVALRGHFDPISGKYYWYGRVDATPEVSALVESGSREITLRTPYATVTTALADVDPWGRPRVEGFGAAPFEVLTDLPQSHIDA